MEKSYEVYRVEGMTLKPGVFTGRDGKPTKFDEQLVRNAFDNICGPLPLYCLHDKLNSFEVKGYATKFEFDEKTNQLNYTSLLFDPDTQKKVAVFDHDKISPELDYVVSGDGQVSCRLTGLAFVPSPAIDGTDVSYTPMMFSKPEDDVTMGNEVEFAELKIKMDNLQKEYEKLNKQHEKVVTEVTTQKELITQLTTERDEAMGKVSQFEKVETDRKQASVNVLIGEIKALGFKDPEKFTGKLGLDEQISVLSGIKEGYVVNAPPLTPGGQAGQSGGNGVNKDMVLKEVLNEMNLSDEQMALLNGE